MPVGDVRQFEASITVSDLFCDGWRSLSPFLFPRDDHRGTYYGRQKGEGCWSGLFHEN